MDVYEIIKTLGSGSFGQVYIARHKREGKHYVINCPPDAGPGQKVKIVPPKPKTSGGGENKTTTNDNINNTSSSSMNTPTRPRSRTMSWDNDEAFLAMSRSKIQEAREMVNMTCDTLGLTRLPSQTNFVYFKSGKEANDVQQAMMEKKRFS